MRSKDHNRSDDIDYDVGELLELDKQDPNSLSLVQIQKLEDGKASFMREYNRMRWDQERSDWLDSRKELLIRQEIMMMDTAPYYDRENGVLTVFGFNIKFRLGSDSEIILKKLFWGGKPVKYPVERGEIKSALGLTESYERQNNKAFYRRVDQINTTISKQAGIDKFLVPGNRKLWFNPDHQDLYL